MAVAFRQVCDNPIKPVVNSYEFARKDIERFVEVGKL